MKIPWRALNSGDFHTGLYYDWSGGKAPGIGDTVLSQRGTLGEWIEKEGCPMERRNFFELLNLLSIFEDKLGKFLFFHMLSPFLSSYLTVCQLDDRYARRLPGN